MKTYFDIPYVENASEMQLLDVYVPDCDSFPVYVHLHGGGLEKGSRKGFSHIAEQLAERGIASVSIEYRMFPDAKYPDFIEDAASAVKWVKDNISTYGKCEGIYVGGSSAGGYLSKLAEGKSVRDSQRACYGLPENDALALRAKRLASEKGVQVSQLAISYFYAQPFPAIPVTAFSNNRQMDEAIRATELLLTAEEYTYLIGEEK